MNQQAAGREAEQQILGAPLHRVQREAGEQLGELGRNRLAQAPVADDDAAHGVAAQFGRDASAGGFDFG